MFGISKRIALIVLSIWLIASGLLAVADIGFPGQDLVLNLLAIASGALILLQSDSWQARIGMMLLGAWLVTTGLIALVSISVQGIGPVMNLLAIAAGVLILVEK